MGKFETYDVVRTKGNLEISGLFEIVKESNDKGVYYLTGDECNSEFLVYEGNLILVAKADSRLDLDI